MIKLSRYSVLLEPNLYADAPLVRFDLGWPDIQDVSDLIARCIKRIGAAGELLSTDSEGMTGLVGDIATWLQRRGGHRVEPVSLRSRFGAERAAFVQWEDAPTGIASGYVAVQLINAVLDEEPDGNITARLGAFWKGAARRKPGLALRCMVAAARHRGVPLIRVAQPPFVTGRLPDTGEETVQLGWGTRQVRCRGLLSDRAPADSVATCADLGMLYEELKRAGFAVPACASGLSTRKQLERAARDLGFPLFMGSNMDPSQQSWTAIRDEEELQAALPSLHGIDNRLCLRKLLPGSTMQLYIVGDRCFVARDEGGIIEAKHNIEELAVSAVRALRLPAGAVTFSLGEEPVITGLTPQPDLETLPEDVARRLVEALLDGLFPDARAARIPLALVTGTNGKTTTCRLLAGILALRGTTGMTSSTGIYVDGVRVKQGDLSASWEGMSLLHDRRVETAVLEVARGGLIKCGLGVSGAGVGAILNIQRDHLGLDGVMTLDELADVKGLVRKGVSGALVLNADCTRTLALARDTDNVERLVLVTLKRKPDELLAAVSQATAVFHLQHSARQEWLSVTDRDSTTRVIRVDQIPATRDGKARHNVSNAAFAAALAAGLDCTLEQIRQGLAGFELNWETAPGRLSEYLGHDFGVILDYAHNVDGLAALSDYMQKIRGGGRLVGVVLASDRRTDTEMQIFARACAAILDEMVCSEYWVLTRLRAGESMNLVANSVRETGFPRDRLHTNPSADEAIRQAMDIARPGDWVLVLGRDDDRAWKIVRRYPERIPEREEQ